MAEITIQYTEVWFIDLKTNIYDRLVNYIPLIEKIWVKNVHISWTWKDLSKEDKFVSFDVWGWRTNKIGIRSHSVQIDSYAKSIEEVDNIKEIIIDLFNRSNFKWIKSNLKIDYWSKTPARKWIKRNTLDFEFIFKDMKY